MTGDSAAAGDLRCAWCGAPLPKGRRRWCRDSHKIRAREARLGKSAEERLDRLEALLRSRAKRAAELEAKARGPERPVPAAGSSRGGSWGGRDPGATIV